MRRLVVFATAALLLLALVPFTGAATPSVTTKHVDGTVKVYEPAREGGPASDREWLARFEVQTRSGVVQFGYLELDGLTAEGDTPNAGEIHEFLVTGVDYYRTPSGAQGATLHMEECIIVPFTPCFPSQYEVSDGAKVGQPDTFLANLGWTVELGNIWIYTTSGENQQ